MAEGRGLFVDNCAGCHRMEGQGQQGIFPPLDGSSVLQQAAPDSAIQLVLGGAEKPATPEKPTSFAMPAFGWKLGDDDVAALLTYLRNAFGNQAAAVAPQTVADVRATIRATAGNAALSPE
jgi:mono/diheme cytochrome c family protein